MIVVVATDEEYKVAKKRFKRHRVIKTGVGGVNVVETLKHIPKWHKIINFGYAGSKTIPVGTEVSIGFCRMYHPNVEYDEPAYVIDDVNSMIWCNTCGDYMEETNDEIEKCVYDMELAFICALGFRKIQSIKIVSDKCNQEEYKKYIKKVGE